MDSVAGQDITLIKRPGKVALLEEAIKKGEWPKVIHFFAVRQLITTTGKK